MKPSKQGSTVGLSVVKRPDDLAAAIALAFRYDDEVMLERFVPGREFTVGILGGEAMPVGEIIPQKEIYDYECKYTPGMAVEVFPAQLDAGTTADLQEQARRAFAALKLRGCARFDFRSRPTATTTASKPHPSRHDETASSRRRPPPPASPSASCASLVQLAPPTTRPPRPSRPPPPGAAR